MDLGRHGSLFFAARRVQRSAKSSRCVVDLSACPHDDARQSPPPAENGESNVEGDPNVDKADLGIARAGEV